LKKRLGVMSVVAVLVMTLFALSAWASDAEMYFSSDKNGQNRVTNIQEGDEIWIVVYDPDKNIDCDLRDKVWADIKVMDPKTGAYIVWETAELGVNLHLRTGYSHYTTDYDYLEETGSDTGLFVSKRAFKVGARENFSSGTPEKHTHVVDALNDGATDFQWGHYIYTDITTSGDGYGDDRTWLSGGPTFTAGVMPSTSDTPVKPSTWTTAAEHYYIIGRFENNNTLVGMYQDPRQPGDVAVTMAKIIDTRATISWDKEVYKDARTAATITIVDPDENLDCNKVEYVPVFILVNPGSWNPVQTDSPTNFCMLMRTGGVDPTETGTDIVRDEPIRWYNIYNSGIDDAWTNVSNKIENDQKRDGAPYFIQYPTTTNNPLNDIGNYFDTVDSNGYARVMFYAQETGVNTGVFQLNLNSILNDLGFHMLDPRDVLVAYYVDPNDFDDMTLAVAYIESREHSLTTFTDASRQSKDVYWIGRDPVYVQVIDANANVDPCCPEQVVVHICDVHGEDDAEWIVLDETSSNSPVFFSFAGTQLRPVWDALGVGLSNSNGGFQLQVNNWKLEVFNEDTVYVRYNDVYYTQQSMNLLGNSDPAGIPPKIERVRVANDVSFDLMKIGDTQVYDGSKVNMYFLDRQGNRVSGYVNSDCIFIQVVDPDQDEDQYRRERIAGYWDGGQNWPFGPIAGTGWLCGPETGGQTHSVNALLGHVDIFNTGDRFTGLESPASPKLYVLNPRSGYWAAVDLLETGVATGTFVSTICIDLVSVYECVPTLGILPGDTIVAVYQDPSNHSDSAWISIKVGIGGGGTPPTQQSTTMFVNAQSVEVQNYTDADLVYVKVIDPSHAGATLLANAVEIDGVKYDLAPLAGAQNDTFITAGLDLELEAGTSITATYTDPTDPTDQSSDTINIIASVLNVERFYAGPNPFAGEVKFSFKGSGVASTMSVKVYDLSGKLVWSDEQANVTQITWNGRNSAGASLANGGYIYVIMATDGTNTFNGKGTVFIKR